MTPASNATRNAWMDDHPPRDKFPARQTLNSWSSCSRKHHSRISFSTQSRSDISSKYEQTPPVCTNIAENKLTNTALLRKETLHNAQSLDTLHMCRTPFTMYVASVDPSHHPLVSTNTHDPETLLHPHMLCILPQRTTATRPYHRITACAPTRYLIQPQSIDSNCLG